MRAAVLAVLAFLAVLGLAPAAPAAPERASLPDIEDEVMCVSCRVALNVAESPQAHRQRELIRSLIAQGLTKEQVKQRLVVEYGADVLAMPEERGIGLAAYAVPIAVVLALAALVALLLPRWRRRARAVPPAGTAALAGGAGGAAPGGAVTDAELARLDEDLRRGG